MINPVERGRIGVIIGRATTPIMQQLVARLELSANLSDADELATITTLQMAFIAGARAAEPEAGVINWELPWVISGPISTVKTAPDIRYPMCRTSDGVLLR